MRGRSASQDGSLRLESGSRVAVIGGGPAGSLFSLFLLRAARRGGLDLTVLLYESRDFSLPAPRGCNMCGGIISETLVQMLAAEGINLPPAVIQRGIDSYVLHLDAGTTRIDTPRHEMRIGAVHRGGGPRDTVAPRWESFDGFLEGLAVAEGARVIRERVEGAGWEGSRPWIRPRGGEPVTCDLLVVAAGVNSGALKLFEEGAAGYASPPVAKAFIREYHLGEEGVGARLGNSMHVFLPSIAELEFAALIPKGDYATLCILGGEDVGKEPLADFLASPEFAGCLPGDGPATKGACQCSPRISVGPARRPYADRLLFVGDCGVTRLYKDGIGAAYRTAKAAANTAVFDGISARDFQRGYWPACRVLARDNRLGAAMFKVVRIIQRRGFARRALLSMVEAEQAMPGERRFMSMVLWNLFTGSEGYREIFMRTLHPAFLGRFARHLGGALLGRRPPRERRAPA